MGKDQENKPEKEGGKSQDKKKMAELTSTLQMVQADFENYRKRVERERAEFEKFACESIITDLLTLLDNFELALRNTEKKEEFIKGIELIYSHLVSMLESRGLKPIKAKGEKFDPYFHEALLQEESDKPGIVLEELQNGYMLNGRIIRHTKVKVGKERGGQDK